MKTKRTWYSVATCWTASLLAAAVIGSPVPAGAADVPPSLEQTIQDHLRNRDQDRLRDPDADRTRDMDRLRDRIRECLDSGVSVETVTLVVERGLEKGFGGEPIGAALRQMTQARKEGLPVGPVADKAVEGLAKNMDEPAILRAMERVTERLRTANALQAEARLEGVTAQVRERLTVRTQEALAAGMDRENAADVFREMARVRNEERTANRLMAAVELMKNAAGYGAAPTTVRELVQETLRNRFTERETQRVMEQLALAKRQGQDMNGCALAFRDRIRAGAREVYASPSTSRGTMTGSGGSGYGGPSGSGGSGPGGSGSGGSGSGGGGSGGGGSGGGGSGGGGSGR